MLFLRHIYRDDDRSLPSSPRSPLIHPQPSSSLPCPAPTPKRARAGGSTTRVEPPLTTSALCAKSTRGTRIPSCEKGRLMDPSPSRELATSSIPTMRRRRRSERVELPPNLRQQSKEKRKVRAADNEEKGQVCGGTFWRSKNGG